MIDHSRARLMLLRRWGWGEAWVTVLLGLLVYAVKERRGPGIEGNATIRGILLDI
jgi:hypothetical protein